MLRSDQIEELIGLVWQLDRTALERQFKNFPAGFPIDFTHDFFEQTPLERLRHIFVALCLEHQQIPVLAGHAA